MVRSGASEAHRKITHLLAKGGLFEAISGSFFLIEVGVGTGPWSDPVRVISFIDLFIDVDMKGVLLRPAENIIRHVVVFLSCERPSG